MIIRQALLTARQEKEIQLKMLITRGESVQRNTSAEGVPAVQKQIQELKDSWDALLSASIQCKRSILKNHSQTAFWYQQYKKKVVPKLAVMQNQQCTQH